MKELLSDGTIVLKAYVDRCVNLYNFEPKKKYIEELEDTSESDATDDDDDNSDESDVEPIEAAQVTSRIEGLSLEEARMIDDFLGNVDVFSIATTATTATISIPVSTSLALDPAKVPCDVCGLMFKPRGLNIHKAIHSRP